jgi:hypothetical protein
MRQRLVASAVFLVLSLVLSAAVAPVAADASLAADRPAPAADETPSSLQTAASDVPAGGLGSPTLGHDDEQTVAECAVTPPSNHADPAEDVLGWSAGYWYDEPLEVDQSDGLNETELDALVARTQARVEAIRCLQFEEDTPVEIISRDTLRNQTGQWNATADERQFENVVYEALLLVDDDNAVEVQQENLGTGVGGYYDPQTNRIVVVSDNRSSLQFAEPLLAHELVHALQDQQFGLSQFDDRTIDGSNAENGIVEGDASLVETIYQRSCESGEWEGTCQLPDTEQPGAGDLANVGLYLISFQPYSDGPAFAHHLYETGEGWTAVNEAYEHPPNTSQQVMYPERYPDDTARNLSVEDRSIDDWERITVDGRPNYEVAGEAALFTMFTYPTFESRSAPFVERTEFVQGGQNSLDPYDYSAEYTDGWDGDRLYAYRNADNETGYVWTLAWEEKQEAATFASSYGDLLRYWDAEPVEDRADTYVIDGEFEGAYSIQLNGSVVRIVHAPTVENLTELHPDAAPQGESNATTSDDEDAIPGFGGVVAALALVVAAAVAAAARHRAP